MLNKTKAVVALQDGCKRLGLSSSTAAALVQFLSVKRIHDQFLSSEDKQLRMSPGAKIDRLWHFMLLNTAVSTQVYELLGGVVEHRGIDSTDLSDESKVLQRLYALNVLLLGGHTPDVNLWTEPGTAMHTLHLTASPIPALQSLPGGGQLYVTPSLPHQQQAQLVQALQLLYLDDDDKSAESCQVGLQDGVQQPAALPQELTHASASATAAAHAAFCAALAGPAARAAASGVLQQSVKRYRTEQHAGATQHQHQQQHQQHQHERQQQQAGDMQQLQEPGGDSQSPFGVFVRDSFSTGSELHFKVCNGTRIGNFMQVYAERRGRDMNELRFMIDGTSAWREHSVGYYGMKDGDTIEVLLVTVC